MIIIIPTIKYGSTYYNTFTMRIFSNYHGFFSVHNKNEKFFRGQKSVFKKSATYSVLREWLGVSSIKMKNAV